ncbi:MAG TPA: nitroreductase [Peptococcaceae bacterium]|jgi:nitroreductase|nr:nitroreductase [Peptococcaceae bacterium]
MSAVVKAIQDRRSIRAYTTKKVEEEKLNQVLEAGRMAPTANNLQNIRFIVVKDQETRNKMVDFAGAQGFLKDAPVVLVGFGEPGDPMRCGEQAYTVDVSITLSYMMLTATELGLGTCWLANFDESKIKEILNIPSNMQVVAMSPLGYAAESPEQRSRKSLEQIVSFDKYSD